MDEKRFCKFCNKDISHLKSNAIICGDSKCKAKYDAWRKTVKNNPRYCEICGKSINDLPSQRRVCTNPECIKEQKRRKYKSATKTKICTNCGKSFEGTLKQKLCSECREEARNKNLETIINIVKNSDTIEQEIRCEHCGKFIKYEIKKNINNAKPIIYEGVCSECVEKSRQKQHKRMIGNNKGKTNRIRSFILRLTFVRTILYSIRRLIKIIKQKYRQNRIKQRMKSNNPMYNSDTRNKVRNTLKTLRNNNLLITKKGSESPLWKGGTNLNRSVRIALRSWVYDKLKERDYTCSLCGKRGSELHVHHTTPLRNIITRFLKEENKTLQEINSIVGSEEYIRFINKIVNYHIQHPEVGIVVCADCHRKIDDKYNRKTNYKRHGKDKNNKKKERNFKSLQHRGKTKQ